jgi:uncharacterized protein involved in response to NO
VLIAWLAVLPWVLFGTGVVRAWLGTYHALAMTQGFLVAVAVGFLGTLIPRRTGAPPMSWLELLLCLGALATVPAALLLERVALAQGAYLVVLATLIQFALRRLRGATRPPQPSFVFLPVGLAAGAAGAALNAVAALGGSPSLLAPGRSLVEEGLLLGLILALAPMLTPLICHGEAAPDLTPGESRRLRRWHLAAAALFLASFAVQHALAERAGLLLRGAVVAAELLAAGRVWDPPSVPGLHRRLYRIALAFVPVGLLAAGARPAFRIPFLHLTFIGGLSLLVFAVSLHVTFMHTGRQERASRFNAPGLVIAALTLAAAIARASAERFRDHYFEALAVASSLWLAAALVWGVYLVSMLLRRAPTEAAG